MLDDSGPLADNHLVLRFEPISSQHNFRNTNRWVMKLLPDGVHTVGSIVSFSEQLDMFIAKFIEVLRNS